MTIHTTKELALKLETAEALNQIEFARVHQQMFANSIAGYEKIGSGYAVFAGVDSPLTQIFALGFDDDFSADQLDRLEAFYQQRKAAVNVEVCHLSDIRLSQLLIQRGYHISEFSNVLLRRIRKEETFAVSSSHQIQPVNEDEIDHYAAVISEGFLETAEIPQSFKELFVVCFHQPNCTIFGARVEGVAAGGGAVFLRDEVAILGGASTLPGFRRQGIQTELVKARLQYAQEAGCAWAMVTTLPGSVSQKNVERQGFQVVYARTKFTREFS